MPETIKKIPELLAPAGNLMAGITAFDAGADAVYAGLSKFNARERSENFTFTDLSRLTAYARSHSRKVYLTLNTLIKENELSEIVELLAELNRIRPDAVIVQDIGVLRIIREYFPDIEVHASTQMGIHNSAGVQMAVKMGVKRVILERQITIDELKVMQKNSPLELEVFVHGALCCSLSGKCLLSSWLGGWSGNRGKCKQPCRRRFYSSNGNGFFFSTQDLSTLDLVHDFKEMGIASLKIEGRLRKADYIRNAVTAYRMLLDAEKPDRKLMGEARKILSGTYGRKWSHGFYSQKSAKDLIKHDAPGAAGLLCGSVELIEKNGFGFKTSNRIYLGDRIRVQPTTGDEGPAMTVTRMSANGRRSMKATSGQECFIFCDKEIPPRGLVYKIGESFDEMQNRLAELPELRPALDLQVNITADEIRVQTLNAECPDWEAPLLTQPARKHALAPANVVMEFMASRSKCLCAGTIHVDINGEYFLPASELKKVRREFWQHVEKSLDVKSIYSGNTAAMMKFVKDYRTLKKTAVDASKLPETIVMGPNTKLPGKRRAIKAYPIFDVKGHTDEVILPSFCPETHLDTLQKMIKDAYERKIRRFRVTALFNLELLKEYKDIQIAVGFPFPVCNSMAVQELARHGVHKVQGWIELEREALVALAEKSMLPLEIYRYGRPPLLSTRADIPAEGDIRDARDKHFTIKYDRRTHITSLYSQTVFSIPRIPGTADYYDLANANWKARDTGEFNFKTALV
jgi:putative protease